MAEVVYITCPLCGMNRVLEKKGSSAMARGLPITDVKGRIRFDIVDLEKGHIVQVREREAGPEPKKRLKRGGGPGFVFRRGFTLEQIKNNPDYADLIDQIIQTCQAIIQILA